VSFDEFVPQFSKEHYITQGRFDIGGTYMALDTTDVAAIDSLAMLQSLRAIADKRRNI
jgi:hypothetical protein